MARALRLYVGRTRSAGAVAQSIFNARVKKMIARRCRVIAAHFDARNRPLVEMAELKDALCTAPERADPGEFRALLMGEGA